MASYALDLLHPHYDALLVANGTPLPRRLFTLIRERAEHLVALDGGLNALFRYRAIPDIVAGDFDSASAKALQWAKQQGAKVMLLPSQESPDVAKGLELCHIRGWKRVLVAGYSGHRTDHVLSALSFAFRVRRTDVTLISEDIVMFPLKGRAERRFHVPAGHTLSWFAFPEAGPCSLDGVRWPFRNRILRADGFHSLSNRPTTGEIHLSQKAGHSLLVVSLLPKARLSVSSDE